ncbi:hypothetical protein CP10139811_0184 [Chlamydia ibidis]|uniref:Transmembrane protein n=2 Tax=Chlamydia ibidis TaxID=1405396 RepID=S7J529_9CHLA|nr:hypothetical protein [Chlamydia ibidis]EPP35303.1 hypothetical protein CP10139811_0184 [Chlamydia ibidis]EQM62561.1 hypothetical protein H359_0627 [Chlamydia ibidis 10-1398/6]
MSIQTNRDLLAAGTIGALCSIAALGCLESESCDTSSENPLLFLGGNERPREYTATPESCEKIIKDIKKLRSISDSITPSLPSWLEDEILSIEADAWKVARNFGNWGYGLKETQELLDRYYDVRKTLKNLYHVGYTTRFGDFAIRPASSISHLDEKDVRVCPSIIRGTQRTAVIAVTSLITLLGVAVICTLIPLGVLGLVGLPVCVSVVLSVALLLSTLSSIAIKLTRARLELKESPSSIYSSKGSVWQSSIY